MYSSYEYALSSKFSICSQYDWQRWHVSFEFFFSLSLPSSNVNIPNIRRQTINVSPPYKLPAKFRLEKGPFVDHHLVACSNLSRVLRTIYQLHAARFDPLSSHCALVKRGPPWPRKTSKNPFIPVEISGCGREIARGFDNERRIYTRDEGRLDGHLNGHDINGNGRWTRNFIFRRVFRGREWISRFLHDFNWFTIKCGYRCLLIIIIIVFFSHKWRAS